MMKFKQRILVTLFIVCVGVLWIWVKVKARNSRRNPVVKVSEDENLLRSLLLDGAYDFNHLDHVHKSTRIMLKDKSTTVGADKNRNDAKETTKSVATSNTFKTKSLMLDKLSKKPVWELWQEMVKVTEVTEPGEEGQLKVDAIVKALQTAPIIQTSLGFRGTQLKASMFLKDNQRTVFKPKRFVYIAEYLTSWGMGRSGPWGTMQTVAC